MKWITREHAHVDRIACPWLIKNFVDKDAEFLFVSPNEVMKIAKEQDAIPFDIPEAELGHHGQECSFDAILRKYELDQKDSALLQLAKIVRGADTPDRNLTPQSEGLLAIGTGFTINSNDDYDNMKNQFCVYDALYTFCIYQNGNLEVKEVLDLETLSTDASIKRSHDFLLTHVGTKLSFVIIYADLVGSTKMSMTLPADKLVTISRAFSYEMSSVVESYDGYVLKYVGDAVIAFFPSDFNKDLTYDKAFRCAKSMITVLKNGINPILRKDNCAELQIKIGIDEGENVVVQHGYDKSSQIDLVGYTMNVAAKITSLTGPNQVSVGENIYKLLHPNTQTEFQESLSLHDEWKYLDSDTDKVYKVYTLK